MNIVQDAIVQATLLNLDPVTIYSAQIESPRSAPTVLSPLMPEMHLIYFLRLAWSVENAGHYNDTLALYRQHLSSYPRHKVYFVCNTTAEASLMREDGIPHILANANCLVDETLFGVDERENRTYDAIYNAQLASWKRHVLARDVPSLALAYHSYSHTVDPYYSRLRQEMPQAVFLNHDAVPTPRDFCAHELNGFYNRSICGLCLSEEEGVMSVAVEYLLSGLPVVTTASRGGRDEFFDEENSIYAEADPESIRDAVLKWKNRTIDRNLVRKKVIEKQQRIREAFIDQVETVIFQARGNPSLVKIGRKSLGTNCKVGIMWTCSCGESTIKKNRTWSWWRARGSCSPPSLKTSFPSRSASLGLPSFAFGFVIVRRRSKDRGRCGGWIDHFREGVSSYLARTAGNVKLLPGRAGGNSFGF